MTKYIVTTQTLENYGAENEPPTQSWRYKIGSTFSIESDSRANAEAIVDATQCSNQEHYKSYPRETMTEFDWIESLENLSIEYQEFLIESVKELDSNGTWINRPNHPTMIFKAPEGV